MEDCRGRGGMRVGAKGRVGWKEKCVYMFSN